MKEYYCTECGWLHRDEVIHPTTDAGYPLCGYCDKRVRTPMEMDYPEEETA